MNNSYFNQFLNNHTWSQLQGSNPMGRKYWESPIFRTKTKGNVVNNVYTKDGWEFGVPYNVPANTKFEPVSSNKNDYHDPPNLFPNTRQGWINDSIVMNSITQDQVNNIEIYKQGLNSGWFPDYQGNFLDLKEPGATTQPCNFNFSQTFEPKQLDTDEQNKFYNIQLGQNMRLQSITCNGFVAGNNAIPNGWNKLPGAYYWAVTK